jgi:putative two-component system response regulator
MMNDTAVFNASVLVVDDVLANVQLLVRMLVTAGYTNIASTMDPLKVCELHRQQHYDLILLDLQMPVMDGFQVMEGLKEIDPDDYLPVIVITAQPGHKLRALQSGAKDFISKPFELAEVLSRVHNMLEVRLLHKQLHDYNEKLEQRVKERTAELKENYLETIFTMMRAAEYKDEDTGVHVQRIGYYCRELAGILGMDEEFTTRIFFASPMHDIGKIGIPDHILLKPTSLTADEWDIMKIHTTMGANILGSSKSPFLKMGAEISLNHHECWDGGGYPHGRRGEEIPLSARIMYICDIYDALRSKRPYKAAFDHSQAVAIISCGDNRTKPVHFDPAISSAFSQHEKRFRDIFESF